jgi:hypothetical protein
MNQNGSWYSLVGPFTISIYTAKTSVEMLLYCGFTNLTIWFFLLQETLVSELCVLNGGICSIPCTATPDMELSHAQMIMKEHGVGQVPVVRNIYGRTCPVGLLDTDSISLTYRSCYIFSIIFCMEYMLPFDKIGLVDPEIYLSLSKFAFIFIFQIFIFTTRVFHLIISNLK